LKYFVTAENKAENLCTFRPVSRNQKAKKPCVFDFAAAAKGAN
jgi:hypothetical protein